MTTRRAKPATVRFYFDADLLGLVKIINNLRADITYPGDPGCVVHKHQRPPCPIQRTETPDEEWIKVVAERRWVVLTRDARILKHVAEIAAVREHGARMVVLSAPEAATRWGQLEILMSRWRQIEAVADVEAPAIFRATRTSLTKLSLA